MSSSALAIPATREQSFQPGRSGKRSPCPLGHAGRPWVLCSLQHRLTYSTPCIQTAGVGTQPFPAINLKRRPATLHTGTAVEGGASPLPGTSPVPQALPLAACPKRSDCSRWRCQEQQQQKPTSGAVRSTWMEYYGRWVPLEVQESKRLLPHSLLEEFHLKPKWRTLQKGQDHKQHELTAKCHRCPQPAGQEGL